MMARQNVYERRQVDESVLLIDTSGGRVEESFSFAINQNEINTLISRGCDLETITLHVNMEGDRYGDANLAIAWCGLRLETDDEYNIRIETFERRSAAAKESAQKRTKREIQKAKDEFAAASKIMEKLKQKFGEDVLTD